MSLMSRRFGLPFIIPIVDLLGGAGMMQVERSPSGASSFYVGGAGLCKHLQGMNVQHSGDLPEGCEPNLMSYNIASQVCHRKPADTWTASVVVA